MCYYNDTNMKAAKPNKNLAGLLEAILKLENITEARAFFRDLCTLDELREMSERWQIVRLLDQGMTYREIAKQLAVSTTTVARVASWFNNGAGGYRAALAKLSHHSSDVSRKS